MKKLSNVVDVQGLTTKGSENSSIGFNNKFFIVKEVVDSYDMAGLLALECPNDKYDKARNYGYSKYHTYGKCCGVPNIDNYNTLV